MKLPADHTFHPHSRRLPPMGDTLSEIETLIEWEAFRPIIQDICPRSPLEGEGPDTDEMVLLKMLVLQSFYGLSDHDIEFQATDRISFGKFLGFPEKIPDHASLADFRERLKKSGKERAVWDHLQDQLDLKGIKIQKGVIQDATINTPDPGLFRPGTPGEKKGKSRKSRSSR